MTVELRWLSAPADEVAAAMATVRRDSRPTWVPTRRRVLVHVNGSLILWYLCIVLMTLGVRHGGRLDAFGVGGLIVAMIILAGWLVGTYRLLLWSARPPSPRTRLKQWRLTLTALANGFECRPDSAAGFSSLITTVSSRGRYHLRFVAPGVEFGTLKPRWRQPSTWHYLAVKLPAPLPHLLLDATSNERLASDLPVRVDRTQHLSLEGDFDRWFRLYAPTRYRSDALYLFTPDVMAALIDTASDYNIEIVDDNLVFFTSSPADFTTPGPWEAVHAILADAVAQLRTSARRYRDERVRGQEIPPVISAINAALTNPGEAWVAPLPRIGPDGRRLTSRDRKGRVRRALGSAGRFAVFTLLYVVPAVFAYAGFLSIIDG